MARYDNELERISSNISTLSNARASSIQVRDTSSTTGFRNTISTTELRLSQQRITVEEENRKAVQFRIGAIDDPRAEIGQLDIDKIDINEKPFIRGKAADKEVGAKRKGLGRFAAFASDLTKRGLGAASDALTADPGNVEGGILPGKASSGSFGRLYQGTKKSWDASKYRDRDY